MRMRCAQRGGISLSRKIEIVAVTAAASDEAQVLLATYRVPDASLHDIKGSTMEVRNILMAPPTRLVLSARLRWMHMLGLD